METTGIISSISVPAVVAQRNALVKSWENVIDQLEATQELARDSVRLPVIALEMASNRYRVDRDSLTKIKQEIDRAVWKSLMEELGVWSLMDTKAREQFLRDYHDYKLPEITEENVASAVEDLYSRRKEMVADGLVNVHSRLSRHHKTNTRRSFTEKVIVDRMLDVWGTGKSKHLSTSYHTVNIIDDLNRVLHLAHGLPEPDTRTTSVSSVISAAIRDGSMLAEFPHFTIKLFKNGNGHIHFRSAEIVRVLNLILSHATENKAIPA